MPDRDLISDDMTRVQVEVRKRDKRTLLASVGGDDNIFTFAVRHQFARLYKFIIDNNLHLYDPSHESRIISFIITGSDDAWQLVNSKPAAATNSATAGSGSGILRDGSDSRPYRHAASHAESGSPASLHQTPPTPPSKPALRRQSNPGGKRDGGEKDQTKS